VLEGRFSQIGAWRCRGWCLLLRGARGLPKSTRMLVRGREAKTMHIKQASRGGRRLCVKKHKKLRRLDEQKALCAAVSGDVSGVQQSFCSRNAQSAARQRYALCRCCSASVQGASTRRDRLVCVPGASCVGGNAPLLSAPLLSRSVRVAWKPYAPI